MWHSVGYAVIYALSAALLDLSLAPRHARNHILAGTNVQMFVQAASIPDVIKSAERLWIAVISAGLNAIILPRNHVHHARSHVLNVVFMEVAN